MALLLFCFYSAGLTAFVSGSVLDVASLEALRHEVQAFTSLPLRPDALDVLGRSSFANAKLMGFLWASGLNWYLEYFRSLLVTWPLAVTFIVFTLKALHRNGYGATWKLLAVLASISPLALLAVAYDVHRFNAMMVMTAFLVLCLCATGLPREVRPVSLAASVPLWCAFLLFLNGASTIFLFESYQVRSFPFWDLQQYLRDLSSGRESFPPIPHG